MRVFSFSATSMASRVGLRNPGCRVVLIGHDQQGCVVPSKCFFTDGHAARGHILHGFGNVVLIA